MTEGIKGKAGFQPKYDIKYLVSVLGEKFQSTKTVQKELAKIEYVDKETGEHVSYEKVSYSWVKKKLMNLYTANEIEGEEIEAGTGTGKMWIWRKKKNENEINPNLKQ